MATIQLPRYILESVGSLGVPGLPPPNGVPPPLTGFPRRLPWETSPSDFLVFLVTDFTDFCFTGDS